MIERDGTWGEVGVGSTLLSPKQMPLLVVNMAPGKTGTWYLAEDHHHRQCKISPKPSDLPVKILECTEEEAILACEKYLGAHRILEAERDRRMPDRAKLWIVPPFPSKGKGVLDRARDHIDWYHGTYSGQAEYAGGFRTLKQITEAHEQMHEQLFMDMPHTHEGTQD